MLNLDYRDARPIYEQVKDGLRRLIIRLSPFQCPYAGPKLPAAYPQEKQLPRRLVEGSSNLKKTLIVFPPALLYTNRTNTVSTVSGKHRPGRRPPAPSRSPGGICP